MSNEGQDHSLTLAKGHSYFKIMSCFAQKLLKHLNVKHRKAYGNTGIDIYANGMSHMTKMAAMSIYSKNI